MTTAPLPDSSLALRAAASHAADVTTVARWLMHDLRGPLQSVLLLTDMIRHDVEALRDADLAASLAESGQTLGSAIESLDRLLRPFRLDRAPAPVVAADVARGVADLLRHRGRGPAFVVDEAVRALPALHATDELLAQMLLALALDALAGAGDTDDGRIVLRGGVRGGMVELALEHQAPPAGRGAVPAAASAGSAPAGTAPDGTSRAEVIRDLAGMLGGALAIEDRGAGGRGGAVLRLRPWTG